MSDTVEIKTETLKALFDLVVGSMDYGSGFFDKEDVEVIIDVAEIIGALGGLDDPDRYDRNRFKRMEPHLWHQDCALSWRCGRAANDPLHQIGS